MNMSRFLSLSVYVCVSLFVCVCVTICLSIKTSLSLPPSHTHSVSLFLCLCLSFSHLSLCTIARIPVAWQELYLEFMLHALQYQKIFECFFLFLYIHPYISLFLCTNPAVLSVSFSVSPLSLSLYLCPYLSVSG